MSQRLQLRVFRAVLDAIETLIREAWPLFKIYVVPWMAGIAAVLLVDVLWCEQVTACAAPGLISAFVFAPFAALVTTGAIRWLNGPRDEFSLFRFDNIWVWVTALYALMALLDAVQYQVVLTWSATLFGNGVPFPDATATLGSRLTSFALYYLPSWLLTVLFYVMIVPQAAIIVEQGAPSLPRQWQLMRLAPLAILLIAVLIGLCRLGFTHLYGNGVVAVGIGDGPLSGIFHGWRNEVAVTIWTSLWLLPANFVTDMLALIVLARTYRALAGYADRKAAAPE